MTALTAAVRQEQEVETERMDRADWPVLARVKVEDTASPARISPRSRPGGEMDRHGEEEAAADAGMAVAVRMATIAINATGLTFIGSSWARLDKKHELLALWLYPSLTFFQPYQVPFKCD